jgi:phosphocarrier protein
MFASEVTVTRDGESVSGTSIMGLMMLAAGPGAEIEIAATGEDAADALKALRALVECGFNE